MRRSLWGRRALEEAVDAGDREVEAHALNNIGSALLLRGDTGRGPVAARAVP